MRGMTVWTDAKNWKDHVQHQTGNPLVWKVPKKGFCFYRLPKQEFVKLNVPLFAYVTLESEDHVFHQEWNPVPYNE